MAPFNIYIWWADKCSKPISVPRMGRQADCLGQIFSRGYIYGPATLQLAHKRITGEMPNFWRCTEKHLARPTNVLGRLWSALRFFFHNCRTG